MNCYSIKVDGAFGVQNFQDARNYPYVGKKDEQFCTFEFVGGIVLIVNVIELVNIGLLCN
jgi:hypothetical protein